MRTLLHGTNQVCRQASAPIMAVGQTQVSPLSSGQIAAAVPNSPGPTSQHSSGPMAVVPNNPPSQRSFVQTQVALSLTNQHVSNPTSPIGFNPIAEGLNLNPTSPIGFNQMAEGLNLNPTSPPQDLHQEGAAAAFSKIPSSQPVAEGRSFNQINPTDLYLVLELAFNQIEEAAPNNRSQAPETATPRVDRPTIVSQQAIHNPGPLSVSQDLDSLRVGVQVGEVDFQHNLAHQLNKEAYRRTSLTQIDNLALKLNQEVYHQTFLTQGSPARQPNREAHNLTYLTLDHLSAVVLNSHSLIPTDNMAVVVVEVGQVVVFNNQADQIILVAHNLTQDHRAADNLAAAVAVISHLADFHPKAVSRRFQVEGARRNPAVVFQAEEETHKLAVVSQTGEETHNPAVVFQAEETLNLVEVFRRKGDFQANNRGLYMTVAV